MISPRLDRPAALGLLASAVGLGFAVLGIFHPAPPRDVSAVPAGVVALVNGQPILMSDFIDETQKAIGHKFADATSAQRAALLRRMVDEELLVQRALALNLPEEDTMVRQSLVDGVNSEISSGVQANPPTEADLRSYFASHQNEYASKGTMNVTDLVLHVGGFENVEQNVSQATADAAQAIYELRSGAPLDQVEQHFSMEEATKATGETLDFAEQIYLGPKLFAAAVAMSDGQVSDPVVTSDGVHVLVMHHRVLPVPADFDSVRNNVYYDYIKAAEAKERQGVLKYLRATAKIVVAPGQSE